MKTSPFLLTISVACLTLLAIAAYHGCMSTMEVP